MPVPTFGWYGFFIEVSVTNLFKILVTISILLTVIYKNGIIKEFCVKM